MLALPVSEERDCCFGADPALAEVVANLLIEPLPVYAALERAGLTAAQAQAVEAAAPTQQSVHQR